MFEILELFPKFAARRVLRLTGDEAAELCVDEVWVEWMELVSSGGSVIRGNIGNSSDLVVDIRSRVPLVVSEGQRIWIVFNHLSISKINWKETDKHNSELQRTDPGTKNMEEFSTRGPRWIFIIPIVLIEKKIFS